MHYLSIPSLQRPSGKKNGAEKSDGRKTEVEGKSSETVANGTLASKEEEATETTTVEAVKEPELSEEEKERMRLQEEDEKRREEIVS